MFKYKPLTNVQRSPKCSRKYRQLYRDMTVARSFVAKCSEHILQQSEILAAECEEEVLCERTWIALKAPRSLC